MYVCKGLASLKSWRYAMAFERIYDTHEDQYRRTLAIVIQWNLFFKSGRAHPHDWHSRRCTRTSDEISGQCFDYGIPLHSFQLQDQFLVDLMRYEFGRNGCQLARKGCCHAFCNCASGYASLQTTSWRLLHSYYSWDSISASYMNTVRTAACIGEWIPFATIKIPLFRNQKLPI